MQYPSHQTAARLAGLSLAALFAVSAFAQTTPAKPASAMSSSAMKSTGSKLASSDVSFMKDAAQGGLAEVEAGKMAVQMASDPAVKSFAQQMVDDHSKNNEELMALASAKGVTLPTEPSLVQRGKMKLLSTDKGAKFDKRYVDGMGVSAHKDMQKLMQKAAASAKDPDVKAFAAKTLPTVQHHLEMAQGMKVAAK